MDARGRALYLSRKRIPYVQEQGEAGSAETPRYYRWLRQTAYRREVLSQLARLPRGRLEEVEEIDLLRALEHAFPIAVVVIDESEARSFM
jgi:3-deoxy-manno-octulosonate cytidylyltransferase (CMP-KDO synthetase)